MAGWDRAGDWTAGLPVAVNASARELGGGFCDRVLGELGTMPATRLIIEVTESSLMRGDAQALAELAALRDAGARIAVDDFGTGFSSLARLRALPVDILKIAQVFIDDTAVVHAIAELAAAFGVAVVAEGVETEAQWECVWAAGIGLAQGYYLHRPTPAERLLTPPFPS